MGFSPILILVRAEVADRSRVVAGVSSSSDRGSCFTFTIGPEKQLGNNLLELPDLGLARLCSALGAGVFDFRKGLNLDGFSSGRFGAVLRSGSVQNDFLYLSFNDSEELAGSGNAAAVILLNNFEELNLDSKLELPNLLFDCSTSDAKLLGLGIDDSRNVGKVGVLKLSFRNLVGPPCFRLDEPDFTVAFFGISSNLGLKTFWLMDEARL